MGRWCVWSGAVGVPGPLWPWMPLIGVDGVGGPNLPPAPCALLPHVTPALGTSRFYCYLCTHPRSVIIFLFRPII